MLDGDLVRRLDVGQVCYVYRGGVTFLQIKRLTTRQAAIGRGLGTGTAEAPTIPLPVLGTAPVTVPGSRPPWEPAGRPGSSADGPAWPGAPVPGPGLPDVGEVLDEAFGERHE